MPAAKLANKSSDPSSTRLQSNVADADPRQDAAEPPSNNSDEEEDEVDAEPDSSFWGGDGSEITMRDGTTFTYRNSFGGHWTSAPFNDSAKAQSWSPALNEAWDYGSMRMLGVNLGGWLVPEPFIAPALFEPFQNVSLEDYGWVLTYALSRRTHLLLTNTRFRGTWAMILKLLWLSTTKLSSSVPNLALEHGQSSQITD